MEDPGDGVEQRFRARVVVEGVVAAGAAVVNGGRQVHGGSDVRRQLPGHVPSQRGRRSTASNQVVEELGGPLGVQDRQGALFFPVEVQEKPVHQHFHADGLEAALALGQDRLQSLQCCGGPATPLRTRVH